MFSEIIEHEELEILKKAFKKYNAAHRGNTLKPNKENTIVILSWHLERDPKFLNQFVTLKSIFESWTNKIIINL